MNPVFKFMATSSSASANVDTQTAGLLRGLRGYSDVRTSVSGLQNDLDAGIFLVRNAMPAGAAGLGRHLPDPAAQSCAVNLLAYG
jgi:hypothetical protein